MRNDLEQARTYSRRAFLLLGGQAALGALLLGRLYKLQVSDAARYAVLAEENRINLQLIIPPRGRILDRHGVPLAVNREDYRAVVVAERARDVPASLDRLSETMPIDTDERRRILREVRRNRRFVPVVIEDGLDWETVARIEVNSPEMPGIVIQEGLARHYPAGEVCAHVLGYVGPVNQREQERDDDPLMELPEFRVGKSGVERQYEKRLRGGAGRRQVEITASGRIQRELNREEPTPGRSLTVTIDLGLQRAAMEALAQHESASAVVLDVRNGDVLAMASSPAFDPNAFVRGIDPGLWSELQTSRYAPLTNKAIAGQYAPGSTFKMTVALAGLRSGRLSPSTRFFCPGHLNLGNARFHCWKRGGHGWLELRDGIKQSCDVYFYNAAMEVGLEPIAGMARLLGFGAPLGIDLPGEQPGHVPSREWKREAFNDRWHPGETVILGIGQGYILTTPLQLATMAARIAGGKAVRPHVKADPAYDALGVPDLGLPREHLAMVRDAMAGVVNEWGGTARGSRIDQEGREMAGKTGTAQVRRITRRERAEGVISNEDLPWERRDHALFVGYAPVHDPRYAVSVVVEHGGGGSRAAAPIARDLLIAAQERGAGATGGG